MEPFFVNRPRTYEVVLHAGGYWDASGFYLGGESHDCVIEAEAIKLSDLLGMVVAQGYSKFMNRLSYFPSGIEGDKRKDIVDDEDAHQLGISCWKNNGKMTAIDIYVVRCDDPNRAACGMNDLEEDNVEGMENDSEEEEESDLDIDMGGIDVSESDDDLNDADERCGFYEGQVFENKIVFKKSIIKYAVAEKLKIKFKRSDAKKVSAICAHNECDWSIYASINSASKGKFVVRTLEKKHTCSSMGIIPCLTAREVAMRLIEEYRANPMTATQIKLRLEVDLIKMSKTKCQRVREICAKMIEDEYAEQFRRMFDYVQELRISNPRSSIHVETIAQVFDRFYACFEAQKRGWKLACRRIIHLDGTHLKGKVKGQLLSAVGRDPNDQMYPVAWAIVPVENRRNWEWFMEKLQNDLEFGTGNGLTLVSDQQKGLIGAINVVCPDVEHRMCARHIWANLKKKHGDSPMFHSLFWKIAWAYNEEKCNKRLDILKTLRPDAYEDVKKYIRHWCRAYFQDCTKSDVVDNNMSESFNNVIRDARRQPIIAFLEFIRCYVMANNKTKLEHINKYNGYLTPRPTADLETQKRLSHKCQPCSSGVGLYEVACGKTTKYTVGVRENVFCTCRKYELSGIPCAHFIAALWEDDKRKKPESYVAGWYMVCRWEDCYADAINPVNGMSLWPTCIDVKVLSPPEFRKKGRPSAHNRRLEATEKEHKQAKKQGIWMKCKNCHEVGHNVRTCPQGRTATSTSTPRQKGRPKKMRVAENAQGEDELTQPSLHSQPNL